MKLVSVGIDPDHIGFSTDHVSAESYSICNDPLGVVEFFFWENQNRRPANLFLMPLKTRTLERKILR